MAGDTPRSLRTPGKPIQIVKLTILFEFHLYRQPELSIFSSEDVAYSFVLLPSTCKQLSTYAFPVMLRLSESKLKTK